MRLHIDVERKVQLIFPTRYNADNFMLKGRVHKIPNAGHPFRFVRGLPCGVGFIIVMASTLQFQDIKEAFQEMDTGTFPWAIDTFVNRDEKIQRLTAWFVPRK